MRGKFTCERSWPPRLTNRDVGGRRCQVIGLRWFHVRDAVSNFITQKSLPAEAAATGATAISCRPSPSKSPTTANLAGNPRSLRKLVTCETVAWPMFVRLLASLSAIDPHCPRHSLSCRPVRSPARDARAQPSRRMALRAAKSHKVMMFTSGTSRTRTRSYSPAAAAAKMQQSSAVALDTWAQQRSEVQ